jgi:P-type Cu+ transporter
MVGTGLAARRGILVRDAQALEQMRDVKVVAFDKTGTLTEGKPRLLHALPSDTTDGAPGGGGPARDELLGLAATLQRGSEHPLAFAVLHAAEHATVAVATAQGVRAVPGKGIEGDVHGQHLRLGSSRWLNELGANAGTLGPRALVLQSEGCSVSWLMVDLPDSAPATPAPPTVLGLLAFGDTAKANAPQAIHRLRQHGLRVVLISGDNRGAASAVAGALGIDEVHAEVSPGDKAAVVASLRRGLPAGAKVAMVGDGVNDAPALAAADVGLAMSTGTDVAMQSAGLTLLRGDPGLVVEAYELSRAITAKLRQNLFWAFAYNVVGIPLAALGGLSPMFAGAAMALSSVSVIGNALLLARWRPATA